MSAASSSERRQFAALYRGFLARVIDPQLVSVSGDARNLLAQFTALLAAYSLILTLFVLTDFMHSSLPHAKLTIRAWGVEEFLISTTITVAGLFSVLAWNSMLPDRRDTFILDPLPVRNRVVWGARAAATGTALGVSIITVNIVTGWCFPFFLGADGAGIAGALRCLLAYWTTMATAGGFIAFAIFALQNAAAAFSYDLFQRISGIFQIAAFFGILGLFFLTPPLASPAALSSASNAHLLAWLPSYWFLGLFHELNGTGGPWFRPLAARAIWSLAAVSTFALSMGLATYRRTLKRIVEQPDVAPNRSHRLGGFVTRCAERILVEPIDRAIGLFTMRTLARSRQHRLIFAVYLGIALALALAYAKALVFGKQHVNWEQPNAALLSTSLAILFFTVTGSRAVFALPFALPANWIFRTTAVRTAAVYFAAIRKSLFLLAAVPVLLLSTVFYFLLWPGRPAVEHLCVLALLGALFVQVALRRFRKIPFTCSYLPGKANLRLKLGIGGMVFLVAMDFGTNIEHWSMAKPARFAVMLALLLAATLWAKRRTAAFAGSPYNCVQFEDAAPAEIYALDLRRDSGYVNEGDYLDAVSEPERRPFAERIKPLATGAILLLAAGFGYQWFGEWRDHHRFPQVGRSVNIGGRSLNLYCAGSGSPTVVMDSGGGMPGLTWSAVEPGVARLTRACWYDRAGYGWSDAASGDRSAAGIANDLHRLLHAAGIAPPYLLVGHSVGGFHVRVFAAAYPSEVAGLVLVDSADEYDDVRQWPKSLRPVIALVARLGVRAGMIRLFDNGVTGPDGHLSRQETSTIRGLQLETKAFEAGLAEGLARTESLEQVKAVRSLGSVPLIVLSGAKKPDLALGDESEAERLGRFMDWRVHVTQAKLATLSTKGRQVILENVGHGITTEAPEAVVDAVKEVLGRR